MRRTKHKTKDEEKALDWAVGVCDAGIKTGFYHTESVALGIALKTNPNKFKEREPSLYYIWNVEDFIYRKRYRWHRKKGWVKIK